MEVQMTSCAAHKTCAVVGAMHIFLASHALKSAAFAAGVGVAAIGLNNNANNNNRNRGRAGV
jgi:hypothetical protein